MVTIINFKERSKEDGSSFFTLEVQGGIEMVRSVATGKFYATAKKAHLPSTFDALTCQALVGTQIPGSVEKEVCEPYSYTIKETGETITLSHKYSYIGEEKQNNKTSYEGLKSSVEAFSMNEMAHA